MKKIFTIFVFAMVLMSIVFVSAEAVKRMAVESKGGSNVFVPAHAKDLGNGVFDLGTAIDVDGREVQGLMFVYKKENARPSGKGKKGVGGSTCYSHLAKGAKWKIEEPYLVDPRNTRELDEASVRSVLANAISEWEVAAGDSQILGNEVAEAVNRATIGDLNGKNEVIFADIDRAGVIGVTIVWGIFGGRPNNRELVEWDQVYDDVDFDWSLSEVGVAGTMDFENIAQHELGHSVGMGHPDSTCTEETMFASAGYGETKKRDLFDGDKEGIFKLY